MRTSALKAFCCLLFPALSGIAVAEGSYSLDDLINLTLQSNKQVEAGRDVVAANRSGIRSAAAYPNPELEWLAGNGRARTPGTTSGDTRSLVLTQPLDLPGRRQPRIAAAEAALVAAQAGQSSLEAEVVARLRLRYYELLRRDAEMRAAKEDQKLMEDIRSRIALKVETGESPRFELIKADAETLNAQKQAQAALFRVDQARASLRQAVGHGLPNQFSVSGKLDQVPPLPPLAELEADLQRNNPELAQARAEVERTQRQLDLERALRQPNLAIKAGQDSDPDFRTQKIGLVVTIPIWDQRAGPIGQAAAQWSRAKNELADREFSLRQALHFAFQQYEIAQTQVNALESGIIKQAHSALKVAESAYRFGERGILDVLDAQRVFRAARNELIAARYELAAAWSEIQRLRALPGMTTP